MQPSYQTTSARSNGCSGGVEDSLSEEVYLGPSIHLAFEELEPRHLTFGLSIAVGELAGRTHGGILLESRREALQVWQSTHEDRLDPALQLARRPLAHHLGTRLGEGRQLGNRRIVLPYLHHVRLLVRGALLRATYQEIRELPSRQAWRMCRPQRR